MSKPIRCLVRGLALAALWSCSVSKGHAQVLRERDLGTTSKGEFGYACANAGDVDGDGVDDFIVGAPNYATGTNVAEGLVVVYSGATGAVIRTHVGANNFSFGFSVAGAGDVDGDGYADYVVGAIGVNQDAGLAVVYSGKSGGAIWSISGLALQGLIGYSVAGVGDLDGDGRGDVLVGANNEAFVVDANGNTLYDLQGSAGLGASAAGCGDLDGDGVNDFLVGEPFADVHNSKGGLLTHAGSVVVYSGATGLMIRTDDGHHSFDYLGYSLASLRDLDGDGVDDYIAASGLALSDQGVVRVISGATGSDIREQYGDTTGEFFGFSVCGMGDVDRDGIPDYAVGAPFAGTAQVGRVRVCSGRDGTTIYEWYGIGGTNISLGYAVASGDWNGDGVTDLLMGDEDYYDSVSGLYTGAVDVELMCPAWWQNFGAGWPGKNGVPGLTPSQNPEVDAPLSLYVGNTSGVGTAALLFVGLQEANIPFKNSGTLLVAPSFTFWLPVPAGGLTLSSGIPDDPSLYFLDVYMQALEVDHFASNGLSFTPGLQLHLGFDLP